MADASPSGTSLGTQPNDHGRDRGTGRGRGKSRGGLGKYLRARGRGHRSSGRPAEFTKRLLLEGEEPGGDVDSDDQEEEAEEIRRRYGRRQIVSNVDRYAEAPLQGIEQGPNSPGQDGAADEGGSKKEQDLDSDGEETMEPEVDLSAFLEKQRLSDSTPAFGSGLGGGSKDSETGNMLLAHVIVSQQRRAGSGGATVRPQKGRMETIEWDESLERMRREKDAADAHRDLKERFRAKTGTLRAKPMAPKERKKENDIVEAPPLPAEGVTKKDPKGEMQDFLDDLLG